MKELNIIQYLPLSHPRASMRVLKKHDSFLDKYSSHPMYDIINKMLTDQYSSVDEVISAINNLNV